MRTLGTALVVGLMIVGTAQASVVTTTFGWEDGTSTILGSYGNVVDETNVTGAQAGEYAGTAFTCPGAHSGERYLHVAENPHASTPQAYVAYGQNLESGDTIEISLFGYDDTAGGSPSLRLWASYIDASGAYQGTTGLSQPGNDGYTAGTGWDEMAFTWTYDPTSYPDATGICIQARLYSSPSSGDYYTDYFIDDLTVTATSNAAGAYIQLPDFSMVAVPEPATMALLAIGGLALIRRR